MTLDYCPVCFDDPRGVPVRHGSQIVPTFATCGVCHSKALTGWRLVQANERRLRARAIRAVR